MVNFRTVSGLLAVLTIVFGASTIYFAVNPTTVTQTVTSTRINTTTQISTTTQTSFVFVAVLIGSNEIPPVSTSATGTAVVTISPDGKTLRFVVTVNNIANATATHIHFGAPGQNNPVALPFFSGPTKAGLFSGVLVQGNTNSTAFVGPLAGHPMSDLITAIQTGTCGCYVNVHTTGHPGGEVRGYLVPAP